MGWLNDSICINHSSWSKGCGLLSSIKHSHRTCHRDGTWSPLTTAAIAKSIITCSCILTSQRDSEISHYTPVAVCVTSGWPSALKTGSTQLILDYKDHSESCHILCQAVLLLSSYSFLSLPPSLPLSPLPSVREVVFPSPHWPMSCFGQWNVSQFWAAALRSTASFQQSSGTSDLHFDNIKPQTVCVLLRPASCNGKSHGTYCNSIHSLQQY